MAVRQAEGDVGEAAGGVDLELFAKAAKQREDLLARRSQCADGHDERIDDDIVRLDAVIGGALDDLLGDREADVRVHRNAGLVIGDRHHRNVVFLAERQDRFELFLLAGHRIDERAALCNAQAGFDGGGNRTVDRQRHVDEALNDLQRLDEERRLGLVRVDGRHARIDVEHRRAGGNLLQRILDHGVEVALDHLGGELLTAGRIDAFADDAEGLVEADDDLACGGGDDGAGHIRSSEP